MGFRIDADPPSINPAGLEIADLAAGNPDWFLLTATFVAGKHCVRRLAFDLLRQQIAFYLPLVKAKRLIPSTGERRPYLKPLFGPYIFIAAGPGQFPESKYLETSQHVVEDWKLIPQLAKLKQGIDAGDIRSLADLRAGCVARVKSGPFKDILGKVDRIDYEKECAFILGLVPNAETEIELERLEAI